MTLHFGMASHARQRDDAELPAIDVVRQALRVSFYMIAPLTKPLHKRQLIERGLLTSWSKHGRSSWRGDNHQALCGLLRIALQLTGLRRRGELNALSPVIHNILLTYDNLPESFCGFKILHLTDLHADGLTGLADAISECLSGLEVDLCVMTGDYRYEIHGPCHGVYPPMERILKSVNARLGVIGILGNHDVSEEVPALEQLGVKMLINKALELRCGQESTWIIGRRRSTLLWM